MKNLKWKMNLAEIKAKAKKHAPTIIATATTITTVVATGLAVYYRNQVVKLETVDPDPWHSFKIPPRALKDIMEGATLKYREAKFDDKYYSQSTTEDEFRPEADESFERFKKTGKYEDE